MSGDPRMYSVGEDVENVYMPNRIPYERLKGLIKSEGVAPEFKQQKTQSRDEAFDEFVRAIRHERKRLGKTDHDEGKISRHLLEHAKRMGMDEAEGKGFWGKLWNGIKSAGSWVGKNVLAPVGKEVANVGKDVLHSVASNPMQTVSMLAPLML